MFNRTRIFKKIISTSMWKFFYRMNPSKQIPNLSHEKAEELGILDEFKAYMKVHESDWYSSKEFCEMFQECPPIYLHGFSKAFYGDGSVVKAGINLSGRVLECLKETKELFSSEQHTFPRAAYTEILINILNPN